MICEYGCKKEAQYQFKNGKWCCENHYLKCPINRDKRRGNNNPFFNHNHTTTTKNKIRRSTLGIKNHRYGIKLNNKIKEKISNSLKGKMCGSDNPFYKKRHSNKTLKKLSIKLTYPIKYYIKKYLIFSKIEEMRYNPNKIEEREIQVHCKNHDCKNSKEQDGWFTPTKTQWHERIRCVEQGNGGSYFYCCEECKDECPLFNLRSDPNKIDLKNYTASEYQTFRNEVLKRTDYICEYCGEKATDVHHSRPQKLEPFFSLDPDFGVACCENCHYKYGHKDECSIGQLANKVCN